MPYRIESLDNGEARTVDLELVPDIAGSANYPADASTFQEWRQHAEARHPGGVLPITWHVRQVGTINTWSAPYQDADLAGGGYDGDDFLERWSWPVDADTGTSVPFESLPIADGVVEIVTRWRPDPYQSTVELGELDHLAASAA